MADSAKKYRIHSKTSDGALLTLHPESEADVILVSEIKDGEKTLIASGSTVQEVLDFLSKNVIPNPDSDPTESLAKIKIGKTVYDLSSKGELIRGYYFRGDIYTDTTYSTPVSKSNTAVYIDIASSCMYTYCGDSIGYKPVADVQQASDKIAGVLKLYKEPGQNEDGTITQKAITEGVSDISLAVDENDEECLVLNNAWATA